jgi:hypothetical protein
MTSTVLVGDVARIEMALTQQIIFLYSRVQVNKGAFHEALLSFERSGLS